MDVAYGGKQVVFYLVIDSTKQIHRVRIIRRKISGVPDLNLAPIRAGNVLCQIQFRFECIVIWDNTYRVPKIRRYCEEDGEKK